jgi:hypothetical protein
VVGWTKKQVLVFSNGKLLIESGWWLVVSGGGTNYDRQTGLSG